MNNKSARLWPDKKVGGAIGGAIPGAIVFAYLIFAFISSGESDYESVRDTATIIIFFIISGAVCGAFASMEGGTWVGAVFVGGIGSAIIAGAFYAATMGIWAAVEGFIVLGIVGAIMGAITGAVGNWAGGVTNKMRERQLQYLQTIPGSIEIKRGYEVLLNNDIRFGIRIINNTDYLIADVETILDYPEPLFDLKEKNDVIRLGNIDLNGKRTAKYTLTPLGCIYNEKIDATIIYRDHTGKRHTVPMRPKEVHCVCPFLHEKPMREGEFAELSAKGKYIEEGLSFSGISTSKIADFIKESCTHRLHTVGEHAIDNTIVLYLAGESIGEKAYYLLTTVIQPYADKDITQIALRAYSDKSHGLHGFLNEITHSIRHLVGSVQSAKEIGVIENKQVINIIDSVVQRTSFGGIGDGTGTTSVNIENSVVQRSPIGSTRRCPNCGEEMQADEKFCTECGVRLG